MLSILLALSFSLGVLAQGNTTCSTSNLDWYSDAVGETPCQTYQRVRRICNPDFTVGSLNPSLPPDTCNDQVGDCCCSSVTFALSMLCLNCQQGARGAGIDAPTGTYQKYLQKGGGTQCGPVTNQSFTNEIQTGVCNEGIQVENGLYNLFWGDGSWFYQYTHDSLSKDAAVNPSGLFSHCSSSSSSSPTSTTPTTTPTQGSNTNNPPQPTPTQNSSSSSSTSANSGSGGGSTPNSSFGIPSSSSGSPTTGTSTTNPNPNPSSRASQIPNSGASSSTSSGVPTNGTDIPSSLDSSSKSSSGGLGTGGIVGISVGVIVLFLIIGLVYIIRMRRRQQRQGGNEKGGVLGFGGGGDSGGAGGAGMSEASSEALVSRGHTNNSTHLNPPTPQGTGIPAPTNRILTDASIRKDRDGLGRDSYNFTRNSDSLAISHENEDQLYELGGGLGTGTGAESGQVWSEPSTMTTTMRPTSPTTEFSLSPSQSASQVGAHNLHNPNNRVPLPLPLPASTTPNRRLVQSRSLRTGPGQQLLPLSESETAITGTETTSYASEYYTTTTTNTGSGTGMTSVSAPEFEEPPPSYYHGHVGHRHGQANLIVGRGLGVINRGSENE